MMQSGIQKFTRENFTIEFIVHRKGGRGEDVVAIKEWNITAEPLPFIDILLDFPFFADFGGFHVRSPIPEAYFVQKMLSVERRPYGSKRDKDLEQCSIIAQKLDKNKLKRVVKSIKISAKNKKAMLASCAVIGFPPQMLGLK